MRFGTYDVEETLGRGGAGTVYRARAAGGPEVAVKVLNRPSGESLARFERERRLIAGLSLAEGFVPLLDSGESPLGPFLVMPCLRGGTLRDWLDRGPLSIDATLALARSLATSLGRAHALGIVHRDLKPENVLFAETPTDASALPLIADLGLAKHFRTDAPGASQSVLLSRAGELRGTAGYMAPEQMRSASEVGPPADVFALGAILHECLAGEPAFGADNLLLLLAKVEEGERRPLRAARPDAPRALVDTIDRALATEPGKRFQDANELRRALDHAPARHRTGLTLALALALTLALALVAVALGLAARARPGTRELTPAPAPGATETPAPVTTATAPLPAWFERLPLAEKPPRLPDGIVPVTSEGEYRNARDGTILVFVPGGPFLMGTDDPSLPDTRPIHQVVLSPYFMGKFELTNERFAAFVAKTGYVSQTETGAPAYVVRPSSSSWVVRKGATWRNPEGAGSTSPPDHPVRQITWSDANAYAAWAGLELPTEAQWEKAALWDPVTKTSRRYAWGNEPPSASSRKLANVLDETAHREWPKLVPFFEGYEDGFVRTAPADSFPDGASAYGVRNMIGNVNEWCRDGYDLAFYGASPERDPVRSTEGLGRNVWRGGHYARVYAGAGYFRGFRDVNTASDTLGVRCALTLAP